MSYSRMILVSKLPPHISESGVLDQCLVSWKCVRTVVHISSWPLLCEFLCLSAVSRLLQNCVKVFEPEHVLDCEVIAFYYYYYYAYVWRIIYPVCLFAALSICFPWPLTIWSVRLFLTSCFLGSFVLDPFVGFHAPSGLTRQVTGVTSKFPICNIQL